MRRILANASRSRSRSRRSSQRSRRSYHRPWASALLVKPAPRTKEPARANETIPFFNLSYLIFLLLLVNVVPGTLWNKHPACHWVTDGRKFFDILSFGPRTETRCHLTKRP